MMGRVSRHISVPKTSKLWSLAPDDPGPGMMEALQCPSDVAFIGSKYFVVADSNGHRLPVFDRNGRLCTVVAGGEVWPSCVAVMKDGKIVVTDRKKSLIKMYDIHGRCVRAFGESAPPFVEDFEYRPHGIAVNSKGQIIVSNLITNKLTVYSPEGKKLFDFGGLGSRTNEVHLPFYLATDFEDNIIVSDNMNFCVKVFDSQGKFKLKIGSGQDWGQRQFQSPYGVTCDPEGNILIADHLNNRIAMYDRHGTYVSDAVSKHDGCLSPCGLTADTLGNIVFTESSLDYTNIKMYALSYKT